LVKFLIWQVALEWRVICVLIGVPYA
jgi:hypothetical protein